MAQSLNNVNLLGRIGSDVEFKFLQSGTEMIKFSLATSESFKNGEEWEEKTEWHNIVAWGKIAKFINGQKLTKGSLVYVSGKINTNKWETKEGEKRYTVNIVINSLIPLNKKNGSGEQEPKKEAEEKDDLPF